MRSRPTGARWWKSQILDRGQRDVDDRDVEDDHELAETDDQQQRVRVATDDVARRADRVHLRTASRMYAASTTAASCAGLRRRPVFAGGGSCLGALVSAMSVPSG